MAAVDRLDEMERAELLLFRVQIEARMVMIDTSLQDARARRRAENTARPVDAEWFGRALAARRKAGLTHQRVQARLALLREGTRERNTRDALFVEAAAELLPQGEYERIWDAVGARRRGER